MQRKMVKWKPFNTLLKYKDILDIERNRNLIDKPVIMEDRIIKIDNILRQENIDFIDNKNTKKEIMNCKTEVKNYGIKRKSNRKEFDDCVCRGKSSKK